MAKADIEINAVAASDTDVPINTLVQLSNNDDGDESTYLWEVVEEPPGAADALSSTVIENPTHTPRKEGTVLYQLTVDQGLPTEDIDRKLVRVRDLKTFGEFPGAEETVEADASDGWALANNALHRQWADRIYDGSFIVGVAGGALNQGDIVLVNGISTIKSGLPGEEEIPTVNAALGTDPDILDNLIGIVISQPDGSAAAAASDLVIVRIVGLFVEATFSGAPAVGDPVYVSDAGAVALTPGTNSRQLGSVVETTGGVSYRIMVDGTIPTPTPAPSPIFDLADGANISPDHTDGTVQRVTLGGNRTMDALANGIDGQPITFIIKQDGTGGRTLTWNAAYKFANGLAPVLSTDPNAVDIISGLYEDSTTSTYLQAGYDFS